MYLSTSDSTKETKNNFAKFPKSYVEVLRMFFISLCQEGLLPIFVLTDKDAEEISSVSKAWSWTT
ncbi:17057_t:CDS:1, partial [Cetraspora pellucida]